MAGSNEDDDNRLAGLLGIGLSATLLVVGAAACAFWRRPPANPTSNRDMEGRVVCITGANVGIGRAVARQLVQRGRLSFMRTLYYIALKLMIHGSSHPNS